MAMTEPDEEWRQKIYSVSATTGFSPWVILGIASRESNFNHECVGDGGMSYTAFQIHSKWFPQYKNASVKEAAMFVVKYLRQSMREGLTINRAIASYNAGRTAVRGQRRGDYDKATTGGDYARDVLQRARHFALKYANDFSYLPVGAGHDRDNPLLVWKP